jgi:hypothetical protein
MFLERKNLGYTQDLKNKIMYELVFWKYLEEVYLNHHGFVNSFQNKQWGLGCTVQKK